MQQQESCLLKNDRFIDNTISDFGEANRNRICGYENLPILSLEQTVEEILSLIPNLMNYVVNAKDKCNRSSNLLTWDESAAIYLYSMPTSFFSCLNSNLRNKDRHVLKPWLSFLKLFIHALEKLPSIVVDVWRGVSANISSHFIQDSIQIWWSINSCSTDLKVIEFYLGDNGTLFAIKSHYGKDISSFSAISTEHEIILMPGSCLYVKSNPLNFKDHLFIVDLEEKQEPIQGIFDIKGAEAIIHRITDVSGEPHQFRLPIWGYNEIPLVSLEEAVRPLVEFLPAIQSYVYSTKQRSKNPANHLSQDESAAIMLYTMNSPSSEKSLYELLNITLRSTDRQTIKPWFPYLKLLLTALARLPSIGNRTVYRGIKQDFSSQYSVNDDIVWWSFTSCTTSINVLKSELFLGKTGQRTMFTIETDSAVDIRNHSYYPAEDEALLLPARQFKVHGCLNQSGGLYLIQLKETQSSVPLLEPIIVDCLYPDGSRYKGNLIGGKRHGHGIYHYTNGEKYVGEWSDDQTNGRGIRTFPNGNRYEGTEKNGKRHGYGIYYFVNEERYEGEWINDKKNGKGKYIWPQNVRYEGTFQDNKMHGQGKLGFANGRIRQGTWENDHFKK